MYKKSSELKENEKKCGYFEICKKNRNQKNFVAFQHTSKIDLKVWKPKKKIRYGECIFDIICTKLGAKNYIFHTG